MKARCVDCMNCVYVSVMYTKNGVRRVRCKAKVFTAYLPDSAPFLYIDRNCKLFDSADE